MFSPRAKEPNSHAFRTGCWLLAEVLPVLARFRVQIYEKVPKDILFSPTFLNILRRGSLEHGGTDFYYRNFCVLGWQGDKTPMYKGFWHPFAGWQGWQEGDRNGGAIFVQEGSMGFNSLENLWLCGPHVFLFTLYSFLRHVIQLFLGYHTSHTSCHPPVTLVTLKNRVQSLCGWAFCHPVTLFLIFSCVRARYACFF